MCSLGDVLAARLVYSKGGDWAQLGGGAAQQGGLCKENRSCWKVLHQAGIMTYNNTTSYRSAGEAGPGPKNHFRGTS